MSSYPSSEGVVVLEETKSRLTGASISATPIGEANDVAGASVPFLTNDDGVFTIMESDKPWMIEILHKDIEPIAVRWEPNGTRKEFIVLPANGNRKPGQLFFIGLALTLCALIPLYLCLHYNVKKAGGPLSNLLLQKITTAQNMHSNNGRIEIELGRQIRVAHEEKVFSSDTLANELAKALARGNADSVYTVIKLLTVKDSPAKQVRIDSLKVHSHSLLNSKDELAVVVNDIDTSLAFLLRTNTDLLSKDKEIMLAIPRRIEKAMSLHNTEAIKQNLVDLQKSVVAPPWPGFVPWRTEPWRYLEILFWALAGVLVHKIITSGVYLWRGTFQNKGIWMHLAHLFTVPMLVLVTMMLLSMISFSFDGNGTQSVVIDIGDPAITRAFSFILAVAPWGVWNFVRAQGERIISSRDRVD